MNIPHVNINVAHWAGIQRPPNEGVGTPSILYLAICNRIPSSCRGIAYKRHDS